MSRFVRLTKGKYEKGILIPEDKIWDNVKDNNNDYYVSTYYYNKEQFEQFSKTGSVKGIRDVVSNKIWFDFDAKKEGKPDPETARIDAIEVITRLKNKGIDENNIQVTFSGSKGFNVVVGLDRDLTTTQVKNLATYFGKDLPTLDFSVYDPVQILRLTGTKHDVSNLFKIPLSIEELKELTIDDIKEKAKSLDNIDDFNWGVSNIDESLLVEPEVTKPKKELTLSVVDKPKYWKDYKWSLLQGEFEVGERHHAMMVLAATCRGMGYDEALTTAMLYSADDKHCLLKGDKPVQDLETNIIPSVFTSSWQGGQYSPESDPWLKTYCDRMGFDKKESGILKISDVQDDFSKYVMNIEENTVKTGIPSLDEAMPITTGMMLGVVGAASSGKTALALKMLKNTSMAGVTTVFASLDMHRTRLFEKLIYSETGLSRKQLYEDVKSGEGSKHFNQVKKNYENVYFYDRSAANVSSIRNYIEHIQESTGRKVKMLMIDYFERISSDRSEDTAASKEVAGALQDLCNDMDLCIIVLVQPNKFSLGGGPESPILSYTAIKGSSFLYQSFRSIISIWRPFFTPEWKEHDKYMKMAILKNDLGEQDVFNFKWDGKRGDITELGIEGLETLKELLKKKENEKAEKDSKSDVWS